MIGVYANAAFSAYNSGTFTGCPSNSASLINHAILLYGWDASGNWLVRNQWGTSWGQSGDMVISAANDCGLSSLMGFVQVANPRANVQVVMDPGHPGNNVWEPFVKSTIMMVMMVLMAMVL